MRHVGDAVLQASPERSKTERFVHLPRVRQLLAFVTNLLMDHPRHYTARHAAKLVGIPVRTIAQMCQRLEIGHKRGEDWILTAEDIEVLRADKRGRSRPTRDS